MFWVFAACVLGGLALLIVGNVGAQPVCYPGN